MSLREEILRAIEKLGFTEPTPIQQRTIPVILHSDRDLIALAQTGTGKTAAFGLPLIQLTDLKENHIQSIILCPTRELCMQISNDMGSFTQFVPGFKTVAVYGGADIRSQIRQLNEGCHVVVGTPGRVLDLINRGVLKLSKIRWVVLDEADEMLNMGFKEDLNNILSQTPQKKRVLLFSATMAKEVRNIANKYMQDPEEVSVGGRNQGAENVRHEYYTVDARDRYAALKRIADYYPNIYGIVFCRTRRITGEIAQKLIADGYNSDALHGELSQAQRDHVMNRFRQKQIQLLIATDVAARGLDVNDLTHVINYDLPDDNEVYIHRTGRTARAGKSGLAISIIHRREQKKMRDIEKMSGKKFTAKKVPTGIEICEKQLFNLVDRVENVEVDEHQIAPFLDVVNKKLSWLSREDLIKHFVSVEFNRFLSYYKNTKDLGVAEETRITKSKSKKKNKDKGQPNRFEKLVINIGRREGIEPTSLMDLMNEQTQNHSIRFGKIDIRNRSTTFEVEGQFSNEIFRAFKQTMLDGNPIKISREEGSFKSKKNKKYKK